MYSIFFLVFFVNSININKQHTDYGMGKKVHKQKQQRNKLTNEVKQEQKKSMTSEIQSH